MNNLTMLDYEQEVIQIQVLLKTLMYAQSILRLALDADNTTETKEQTHDS